MPALIPRSKRAPVSKAFLEGDWINANQRMGLEDLKGSPTFVVGFRTGHVVTGATLRQVQTHARAHGAKALGVHVPLHENEATRRTVRNTVLREGITVPVRYGSPNLPWVDAGSVILLDDQAHIAVCLEGPLDKGVMSLARGLGEASAEPPAWTIRGEAPPPTVLLYPQGLATREASIAIADTAHHRIVLHDGTGISRFGSGVAGNRDGPSHEARFSHPRGVHLHEEGILVADSGNGALRWIRPKERIVETLVGPRRLEGGQGPRLVGPMPWDLDAHPYDRGHVVVTLTGRDRVVSVDVEGGKVQPLEDVDALRSPLGVATDGSFVFVSQPPEGCIVRIDPERGTHRVFLADEPSVMAPAGLDVVDGVLAIADPCAGVVHRFDVEASRLLGPGSVRGFDLVEPWTVASWEDRLLSVGDEHRLAVSASGAGWELLKRLGRGGGGGSCLDPIEVGLGGRLALDVGVHEPGSGAGRMGALRVRGPVEVDVVGGVKRRGGEVWSSVEVVVLGSGWVEVSWGVEEKDEGGERGWRWWVPVVVRRGGRGVESVQLTGGRWSSRTWSKAPNVK